MNEIVVPQEGVPPAVTRFDPYDGTTYYGRAQLKSAPFENAVVGGYIFLAGLSGSSAILAALADASGDETLRGLARHGRYLALAAPILGAPLLIYDLHTPARFYNMLRVAKATSPMSIGTWILMGFSATALPAAALQFSSDRWPNRPWLGRLARLFGVPAALLGAGLSTYTASLLSATSTPVWAASPRALAVRFGASSMASAAAALMLLEDNQTAGEKLETVMMTALVTEAVGEEVSNSVYRDKAVSAAFASMPGRTQRLGTSLAGIALPLGLMAVSALLGRRDRRLPALGAVAVLAGSAVLRVSMMSVGDVSAERPDVSFRFSTPRNLP